MQFTTACYLIGVKAVGFAIVAAIMTLSLGG
jgi:hypothetical protein